MQTVESNRRFLGGSEHANELLQMCQLGVVDEAVALGEVRGVICSRLVLAQPDSETLGVSQVTVGTEPTKLDAGNAYITMGLRMAKFREQLVARLVREARQQLPDEGIGVVFVNLGGGAGCRGRA